MADRTEHLGWIRLVNYQGVPTYVCVTSDPEWVVGGGDSLRDAAETFFAWSRARRS